MRVARALPRRIQCWQPANHVLTNRCINDVFSCIYSVGEARVLRFAGVGATQCWLCAKSTWIKKRRL